MTIKSLKARLKALTPPVIVEDVERDRSRWLELRGRSYVPGLTPAEKNEYAKLDVSLKKADEPRRRLFSLTMKDFEASYCDGEPLTEAERRELVELSKRHPSDSFLESSKIFALVAAGKDLSIFGSSVR